VIAGQQLMRNGTIKNVLQEISFGLE